MAGVTLLKMAYWTRSAILLPRNINWLISNNLVELKSPISDLMKELLKVKVKVFLDYKVANLA